MTRLLRFSVLSFVLVSAGATNGQEPRTSAPEAQPRFRGGANLVRVDTYVTAHGAPVRDLAADDFEVLEDGVLQRIESFQLVQPRGPGARSELREPNTVAESRDMARDAAARVFVLFMDIWHVQIAGSYRAQGPMMRLLDRVIGQDDLFGVMTPEMSARTLTLARRTDTVEGILKRHWHWGERDQAVSSDPREEEIEGCYPNAGTTRGIAAEMIRRRREGRTLDALESLVPHLEAIREERKFVVLLTEGWLLDGPNPQLARAVKDAMGNPQVPAPPNVGTDPGGRLRMERDRDSSSIGSCERERSMLAHSDHRSQFERLLQRANRANVSFYPVDARGLVAFDENFGPNKPVEGPVADAARLTSRREALRTLAANTDGYAILDTNNIDASLDRMVQDTGAYYLLGYYSTNARLDGRFRRLTVRVKRDGVDVRSRPGYLAPSEAELASTRVDALMNGAPAGHTTIAPSVARAFSGLAPARGTVPVRVQAISAPDQIWLTGEFDPSTLKADEWQQGGRARVLFQHDRGDTAPLQVDVALERNQRTFQAHVPPGTSLAPGRYVTRIELTPAGSRVPLQTTIDVTVPGGEWLVSESGMAARRGPSTGLHYALTADARYRRTERIRLEVPRSLRDVTVTARLLGRDGQPLAVSPALSERTDAAMNRRFIVADLTLAPLAQGEYVIEIVAEDGALKDSATYAFRVIP